MRLFIAEKPQVAMAIAEALSDINNTPVSRKDGYILCGKDAITWCLGHLLQLQEPETINPDWAIWKAEDLPIWLWPPRYCPRTRREPGKPPAEDPAVLRQLNVISSLARQASRIVHAGDPDDEGQLLVEEVLVWIGNQLPVDRILINDITLATVKKALADIRDNRQFWPLYQRALARSVGDQMFGYNMTRACTVAARARYPEMRGVLPVGRVQTPTLGLVVNRWLAVKNHQEAWYFTVDAAFSGAEHAIEARMQVPEDAPCDEKKRISDEGWATRCAQSLTKQPAVVENVRTGTEVSNPPLPLTLLDLQRLMARQHSIDGQTTLAITQSLRDNWKAITYNRSDCPYLSDDQYAESPALLDALQRTGCWHNLPLDPSRKSAAFNTAKVGAHTAIIPTTSLPDLSRLNDQERLVWQTIAEYFLVQFMQPRQREVVTVTLTCRGQRFMVRARRLLEPGYTSLLKASRQEDTEQDEQGTLAGDNTAWLKRLVPGQQLQCVSATAVRHKTTPPPLFTEDTLLAAMARIADFVTDERVRALLRQKDEDKEKENGGIGTAATRAGHIQLLRRRGLITEMKGKLIPTENGIALIRSLPPTITRPDLTALWVERQNAIIDGRMTVEQFAEKLHEELKVLVVRAADINGIKPGGDQAVSLPCPGCRKPLRFWKDNVSCSARCGFRLSRTLLGKELTQHQLTTLLTTGRSPLIRGFKGKNDKTFDAYLVFRDIRKGDIGFVFPERKKKR
ncbi:TPA: topoisomerase C-terminal repeat-containing protein [Escherichia coli]|nr:topoisomerase C-terminal repeat-containing protein [Escherichia coli]MDF8277835.1 DNA topoisomerase [Escherichia coli]HCS3966870.1 topoisomerase C-terminal repeat-containing protein [Escherichia coli]HEA2061425.1 topoisomerase C-terminal repeat-containing protein [Escherichia coli]